jgi:predicted hotdog family 3-hydroxylacyl-ACP dehydratase
MKAPPIEELLPHRYGMLLVDRVVAWDAASATVSASPSADGWYAEAGGMPSRLGIELMAQAIAAHVSVVAWSKGEPPKKGVLLGARSYRATQPYFAVGSELIVKATRAFSDDSGMGAYDCTIENAAKARILVFEPPDFEAFIAAQKQ